MAAPSDPGTPPPAPPPPGASPGLPPGPPPGPPATPGDSPYRNLWVPLVVVPFLVVAVLVFVFFFFGAIRGREATLEENLQTLVEGGTNERKQAAVRMSYQVVENRKARDQGHELPWEVAPGFLERLQQAWRTMLDDDNHHLRLALAVALVEHGDPGAREKLESFLDLDQAADPEGQLRFQTLLELGALADPASAPAVIPFLESSDPLLRQGAAAALQSLPGEATLAALKGVLGDPSLELRGMAAISLAKLGDDAGAHVLADLADPATYEAIRAEHPRKFADPKLVQTSRYYAVEGLARLGREEDLELLRRLAEGDEDLAVREAAMRALEGR